MTDRDHAGVEVNEFAPMLAKKIPNGPCFSKDEFLLQYPAAEFFYESPDVGVSVVLSKGHLIPKLELQS